MATIHAVGAQSVERDCHQKAQLMLKVCFFFLFFCCGLSGIMWNHLTYKIGAHPLKALSELNIFFCFVPSGIMWNHLTYKMGAHPLEALSGAPHKNNTNNSMVLYYRPTSPTVARTPIHSLFLVTTPRSPHPIKDSSRKMELKRQDITHAVPTYLQQRQQAVPPYLPVAFKTIKKLFSKKGQSTALLRCGTPAACAVAHTRNKHRTSKTRSRGTLTSAKDSYFCHFKCHPFPIFYLY